jgi:predicted RNase H-like nuclease (RuvC/YqgF family)
MDKESQISELEHQVIELTRDIQKADDDRMMFEERFAEMRNELRMMQQREEDYTSRPHDADEHIRRQLDERDSEVERLMREVRKKKRENVFF